MPRTAYALILAFALAAPAAMANAAPPAATVPQAASQTLAPTQVQYRRHYRRERRSYYGGRQIACTPYGCHPIARGCHPTPGYDFWGNPTGYDDIVCPRR